MKRLIFTHTGTWRTISASPRLDFTQTGNWRVIAAGTCEALQVSPPDGNELAAQISPRVSPQEDPHIVPDTAIQAAGLEVQDLDAGKWDEIAPLFPRSDRAPD